MTIAELTAELLSMSDERGELAEVRFFIGPSQEVSVVSIYFVKKGDLLACGKHRSKTTHIAVDLEGETT